jgi:hypothetical protein
MEKYRVWYIANPPTDPTYYDVATPEEGADKINKLSKRDLKNPNISANAMGLEVSFVDGEWEEWYDENGEDIDSLAYSRW